MVKMNPLMQKTEIALRDMQALDTLTSGMQDSKENKEATRTYLIHISRQLESVIKQLNKEASGLLPFIPASASSAGGGE